jgi:peptide-methionine (S)-S-oxide reductase
MIKKAYLAGGCFWGMEDLFRSVPGVIDTTAGYTGGENEMDSTGSPQAPTYEDHPGYAEALEIVYDDTETSFWKLLDFFFQIHNPTTLNRQGNDVGTSYRSAIFYQNEEEKKQVIDFIKIVNDSKRWKDEVVTTLEPFTKFWVAEKSRRVYLPCDIF